MNPRTMGILHGVFMIYLGAQARGIPQAAKLASIVFGVMAIVMALRETPTNGAA